MQERDSLTLSQLPDSFVGENIRHHLFLT